MDPANLDPSNWTALGVGVVVLGFGVKILGQQGAGWKEVLRAANERADAAEAARAAQEAECQRRISELEAKVERLQQERFGGHGN